MMCVCVQAIVPQGLSIPLSALLDSKAAGPDKHPSLRASPVKRAHSVSTQGLSSVLLVPRITTAQEEQQTIGTSPVLRGRTVSRQGCTPRSSAPTARWVTTAQVPPVHSPAAPAVTTHSMEEHPMPLVCPVRPASLVHLLGWWR